MTNEQREAIEITSKYLNFNEICGTRNFKEAIETVLSMLKEKDNLINEQLKENVRLQKELNEENKRCMILANNDKFKEQVIDLMADELVEAHKWFYSEFDNFNKEDFIKYFANKVNSNLEN